MSDSPTHSQPTDTSHVFAYGTLMFPEVSSQLAGINLVGDPATVVGYRRYEARTRVRGNYPAIQKENGGQVEGVLLRDVTARQLRILDWFEGVEAGLYTKHITTIQCNDEPVPAVIYVCGPLLRHQLLYDLCDPWEPEAFREHELDWYVNQVVLPAIRSDEYLKLFGGG